MLTSTDQDLNVSYKRDISSNFKFSSHGVWTRFSEIPQILLLFFNVEVNLLWFRVRKHSHSTKGKEEGKRKKEVSEK